MNHETLSSDTSVNRGPSWGTEIIDPVWVTRTTLDPRPAEQEHVLSRYQFNVHLGAPMPVEFYQGGKKRTRILHFGDLSWTLAGDSCRETWVQMRKVGFVTFSPAFIQQTADEMEVAHLPAPATIQYADPLAKELVLALVRGGSSDRLYTDTRRMAHCEKTFALSFGGARLDGSTAIFDAMARKFTITFSGNRRLRHTHSPMNATLSSKGKNT